MAEPRDPFYIGYEPTMPSAFARRLRPVIAALLLGAPLLAVVLAGAQRAFDVAFFSFGSPAPFSGTLVVDPYPSLLVERPNAPSSSRYLLVAVGKHGLSDAERALAGRAVTLEGTLIYRDDQTMLEVVPGSLRAAEADPRRAPAPRHLGTQTLRGEIVDSKCYLGVMKPGYGKPHRACATLCIRGGIPPIFVTRNPSAPAAYLLLVDEDGSALGDAVLPFVAETVDITGDVIEIGDRWLLRAAPGAIRRLPSAPNDQG